jgi:Cu/Ag efflux protein CusF
MSLAALWPGHGLSSHQVEHFAAEGTMVNLDPGRHLVTIEHGDIQGLMSSMTMAFPVASPALFERIAPGDRVKFTLQRSPQGLAIVAVTKPETSREALVLLAIEGMT